MSGGLLFGTDAADSLSGTDGADLLFAFGGSDGLVGGDGDDLLFGGPGNDTVQGDRATPDAFPPDPEADPGRDAIFGGSGDDLLLAGGGDDLVSAGPGDDVAQGGSGQDTVLGGDGDDRLSGGRPQLVFFDERDPEDGPDLLRGGAGNDEMLGGRGDDLLRGEGDGDTLSGGFGADTLDGGAGGDVFSFGTRETNAFSSTQAFIDTGLDGEADVIRDFHQGEDRIDLSAVNSFSLRFIAVGDFVFDFICTDAFSGEGPEARYDIVGNRTVVQLDGVAIRLVSPPEPGPGGAPAVIDVPTDGIADAEIVLAGRIELREADFLL